MSDMAQLAPRLFTVDEFQRMAETGILAEDERIELLDGRIVEMSPIGPSHVERHARLVRYLNGVFGESALVVGAGSFPLGARNQPQPDIAIVRPAAFGNPPRYPDLEDIIAFVELADSSYATDLGLRLRLYARYGIPDYLVVDLRRDRLIHNARPSGDRYERTTEPRRGEAFNIARLPEVVVHGDPFLNRVP